MKKYYLKGLVGLVFALAVGFVALGSFCVRAQDVQRIAAVVNDEVISAYDLQRRLGLIIATAGPIQSREEMQRLQGQILRAMVDEKLQLQEARKNDITISDAEVEDAFNMVAQSNKLSPKEFTAYLRQLGLGKSVLTDQIRAELAWRQLVSRRLRPSLNISDAEIEGVLERMKANTGKPEYLLSEIVLIIDTPSAEAETRQTAQRLVAQLRAGARFAVLAHQFSEAATAAVGGDLGWIQQGQLDPKIDAVLEKMPIGRVSDPIETADGFHIIKLRDRRKIMAVDELDVGLTLKQIALPLAKDALPAEIEALKKRFASETRTITSCDDVPAVAKRLGSDDFGDIGKVRVRDLPANLQAAVKKVEKGHASEPIVTGPSLRVFIVCDRIEPKLVMPTFEAVENMLSQQKLAMMARRYLRDLRRDTIIDYR